MNLINLLKQEKFIGSEIDTNRLITYFYTRYIKVSYYDQPQNIDPDKPKKTPRRFIFTSTNKWRNYNNDDIIDEKNKELLDLVTTCNGIVVIAPHDGKDWQICSFPPPFVKTKVTPEIVNNHLNAKLYRIFPVEDGSMVTLYHWQYNDPESKDQYEWRISSHSGVDVSNQVRNTLTFRQMLHEILVKYNIPPDEFYKKLNPTRSYNFIIKHPELHYFQEGAADPIYRICFIQSNDNFCRDPLISRKTPLKNILTQKDATFQENERNENACVSINTLYSIASHSIEQFSKNNKVCYGFILRSIDWSKTGFNSNILIESSLLNFIKSTTYDIKISAQTNQNSKHCEEFYIYALMAFLNGGTNRTTFTNIFPQAKQNYDIFNNIITKLSEFMMNLPPPNSNNNHIDEKERDNPYYKYALYLQDQMAFMTTTQNKGLILDFIVQPKYLQLYNILYKYEKINKSNKK